jgi:hypothetical protein
MEGMEEGGEKGSTVRGKRGDLEREGRGRKIKEWWGGSEEGRIEGKVREGGRV